MTSQTYATRHGHLMQEDSPAPERLLTPAEVAAMFRVDPKTVTRWAKAGKLSSIRTLGGHRRYREAEVHGFLAGGRVPMPDLAR
jgi:excisionase family DNA binding protein